MVLLGRSACSLIKVFHNMSNYILSALADHAQSVCPFKRDTVRMFGYVCSGTTPLDEVVQLRQNRIVRIDLALGSVLLCLRRRCAFRGHLELKVDRYVANPASILRTFYSSSTLTVSSCVL